MNVSLPAGTEDPEISSVDLLTGTIFDVASATQTDLDRSGVVQVFFSTVALVPPPGPLSVSASGVLANITIDATGFTSGSFDLLLSGILPGLTGSPFDTKLLGTGGAVVPATVSNGLLTVLSKSDADFDVDTDIDGADFLIWQRGFGVGTTFPQGDANGDGDVDASDLSIWGFLFSTSTGSLVAVATTVPEPASSFLLLVGFVMLLGTVRGAALLGGRPEIRELSVRQSS